MKKRILSLLTVLLVAMILTSTVGAGGNVGFSKVQFSLGSLIAEGYAQGLGRTDVTVELVASGIPVVTCVNQGGNESPGQNPVKVIASDRQFLPGNDPLRKNGRAPFLTETNDPENLPGDVAGCPNSNWTGRIDFISWTEATLSAYDTATGALLERQDFACTTTRFPASVRCEPK
jgi:hypothetical protein